MRHTRGHTGNRRSHHALTAPGVVACKNCGAEKMPHKMCLACGAYRGRVVVDITKTKKKASAVTKKVTK